MRHQIKKTKFKKGYDAKRMLLRKLSVNFLKRDSLLTTIKKAKILKTHLEKLLSKTKIETEANKNYLLRLLGNQKLVKYLFKNVGPIIRDLTGGYVKIIKENYRDSDGSLMARVEWTRPVVNNDKNNDKVENDKKNKVKNQN